MSIFFFFEGIGGASFDAIFYIHVYQRDQSYQCLTSKETLTRRNLMMTATEGVFW